uniref:CSON009478 protein n=1 Tax=Culicoides sonorensis TaxID=179676 RepID=A0A336KES3_CULSO
MKRNKKRSSILKRTSMSNSESSSPAISETGQQNGTKTSKRISFSKRLSVKEFASGDDCITIWNNSYEQSADNCNTVSITNDKHTESNIIGDKIESHDLPILTGPNKENIILHNDLQISVTDSSMSATIRMDNSTVINQYFYKSPGKLNDKETIQNASMDLEDLKPYMYVDQSSFKTQLENSSSSCNMNLKTEQENESSDSEMSMEFFSGELAKNRSGQPFSKHKTLVFEKEELDITHTTTDIIVPKEKEIKNSEIDSTKAMKRNRRQTKIEINDMEISTTPIAPAKRDRRETVYDDPSVDLTLINNPKTLNQSHKSIGGNIKQDISKMFIDYTLTEDKKINKHIHNEKVPTVRCRQTIYFNNECILNDQPNNQKSISNKTANIIPTSEVEDMDETLVLPVNKCDNKSVEKELVFETCKNIQESHGDSTLFLAQTMQTSNFLIQEHVQENKGLKDIDDAINHCKINRKTKYFENDQMTIEPKIVLSSKSQYDTSPINVIDTKSQQNSKSNRQTIHKYQPMNETLVGQMEFNLNTDSEKVHIMSLEMDTKSQQNSKTKRQTIHKYQPMNETLVGQMEFNLNTDSESKAINTSHEEVHRMSLEMDTKSNRQTIYKNQPMIETLVGQKEFNLNTDSESKATNTPHEEVHRMSLEKDTKSQQNSKTKRQTIHKNQPMNETLVHQMEFNFNTDLERKATKIHHADEQKTAVDALRIELQTLNVSPQHNIAKNNRRATIIFKEDNEQSSDIDLTLQNISPKKVCEDIDESKIHEIKMPQCSSKIPKPIFKPTLGATSIILQNELNVSNTQNRTIYEKSMHVEQIENPKNLNINDKLDVLESKNTITDLEESQNKKTKSSKSDLRQTIFFKNTNITSDASFVSDTTTNKRSKNSMCTEELYSKYEEIPNVMDKTYTGMDNLSYKRFNNLNNTMQNNESLDKISDVNLTLNDTQKSSIDPITACSYANITMVNSTCSKTPELFNAFKLENTNNQSSRKSFTMSESTIAESSFLISSLDGLSPNVSARRSLCNEIYEQIRLKVLKATTTNTCPCKCSQESQSINLNTTSTLPDWLKTNKRTYCGKSVAEMEKDFDVQLAKLDTDQNTSYLKPETPSVRFLLENLREGLKQELEQIPEESRCPAPYPSNKPYYYLLKNKLHSENLPWALVNIITAPGGIIQLRNEKLKSVLLTIKIEPNSFKDNGLYLYSSIKFLPNSSHPVSSPFAAVLFEKFSTACPSESSLLYMCSNSNQLFEFLAKIDHKITEICTNTVQLFSILSEYGCTPFIEDSQLMAKKAVVNHSMMQVFRFYLNLTDVNNFQPSDIAIIPECTEVKEKLSKCLIRGIELLEYFLKNIEIIL